MHKEQKKTLYGSLRSRVRRFASYSKNIVTIFPSLTIHFGLIFLKKNTSKMSLFLRKSP